MEYNLLLLSTLGLLTIAIYLKNKQKRKWMKKWHERRYMGKGVLNMLNTELLFEDPNAYKNFLRVDTTQFQHLLSLIEPAISRQDRSFRECVPAKARLEITLRFLATGESYRSLMYSSRIHESTISKFIPEVCTALVNALKDKYLKTPTSSGDWEQIAEGFYNLWQFPHCLGALDGKHVLFRPPRSAGSFYYNYKGGHSIVLLAMADAHYKFIYVNVGANGRVSDGGLFRESNLFKCLTHNSLNIPTSRPLHEGGDKFPYVIVADEAFPLSSHLLKPYPPRNLSYENRIFNYRLSRARRVVENSFGILTNRFRILLNPINLSATKVEKIVLACVALHNYLAIHNWSQYINIQHMTQLPQNLTLQGANRPSNSALQVRDKLRDYFCSELGTVAWQDNAISNYNCSIQNK